MYPDPYPARRYVDIPDDWLTVPQCARRLGLTEQRVMELCQKGALRSAWDGVLWVQPAILSGAV